MAVKSKTKNILLQVRELADLYALKTLYDYLAQNAQEGIVDVRLWLGGDIYSDRSREVLQNIPLKEQAKHSSIDTVVSCYSDLGGSGDVEIDIYLLKNCVVPLSPEEKKELKQKYRVTSQEPVVVISYASPSSEVTKLIETVSKYATVYVVGSGNKEDYKLSSEAERKVHVVRRHGVLKDYYALADAAINASNLFPSTSPLHNFVEATEGGPLFMAFSTNSAQYGYRQLVEAGAIVECADAEDVATKVKAFLQYFEGKERITKARARHLAQSREKYLPVIAAQIQRSMGEEVEHYPDTDLIISLEGDKVRMMHPDSNWSSYNAINKLTLPAGQYFHSLLQNRESYKDIFLHSFSKSKHQADDEMIHLPLGGIQEKNFFLMAHDPSSKDKLNSAHGSQNNKSEGVLGEITPSSIQQFLAIHGYGDIKEQSIQEYSIATKIIFKPFS